MAVFWLYTNIQFFERLIAPLVRTLVSTKLLIGKCEQWNKITRFPCIELR